jgi:hypothetical protein
MWPEKNKLSNFGDTDGDNDVLADELLESLTELTDTISSNSSNYVTIPLTTSTSSTYLQYNGVTWDGLMSSTFASPHQNFNKNHRKLSFESFVIVLETMKEDDYDKYLMAITDVITHTGFRMLTDEYLTEIAVDIEKAEREYTFSIEDHYNLDDFPSYKLLRKLQ